MMFFTETEALRHEEPPQEVGSRVWCGGHLWVRAEGIEPWASSDQQRHVGDLWLRQTGWTPAPWEFGTPPSAPGSAVVCADRNKYIRGEGDVGWINQGTRGYAEVNDAWLMVTGWREVPAVKMSHTQPPQIVGTVARTKHVTYVCIAAEGACVWHGRTTGGVLMRVRGEDLAKQGWTREVPAREAFLAREITSVYEALYRSQETYRDLCKEVFKGHPLSIRIESAEQSLAEQRWAANRAIEEAQEEIKALQAEKAQAQADADKLRARLADRGD